MPSHSGWVVALVLAVLMTALGAASERSPLQAASVNAGLGASFDAPGAAAVGASVDAKVDAPLRSIEPLPTLPPLPSDGRPGGGRDPTRPEPAPGNGTAPPSNGTNETYDPPNPSLPTASNNTTADAPPDLSPPHQNVSGQAGAPIRFVLLLTNPASTTQNVTLSIGGLLLWGLDLHPTSALLGPDEVVQVRGTVHSPPLTAAMGTVLIVASGSGGEDNATVDVCARGILIDPCGPPSNGTKNETRPPANETPVDPAPEPTPDPGANETAETPPAATNETPGSNETPESNETPQPPATNETGTPEPPAGNETGSPPPSPPPSGGGQGAGVEAEAWVTVEASTNDEDDESPAGEVEL